MCCPTSGSNPLLPLSTCRGLPPVANLPVPPGPYTCISHVIFAALRRIAKAGRLNAMQAHGLYTCISQGINAAVRRIAQEMLTSLRVEEDLLRESLEYGCQVSCIAWGHFVTLARVNHDFTDRQPACHNNVSLFTMPWQVHGAGKKTLLLTVTKLTTQICPNAREQCC